MDELDSGTATEAASQGLDSPEPTGEATASATPAAETPAVTEPESFIDPSQLPEELKPHWKRMHGAYTKTREELKSGREARSEIQKFYSDLAYQEQILQRVATQRGYQLVRPNEQAAAPSASPTEQPAGQAPADFVEKIKSRLAPELQWMAPSLAATQWEGIQAAMQPLMRERQAETQSKQAQEYEEAATALGTKFPGWEAEEENMSELLGFLQSKTMHHPKFGNRLEVLYKASQLLAGHQGHVVQDYAKRTADAARSRTVSSNAARPSLENYQEQIRKAPNTRAAFAIAAQVGMEEAKRLGATNL
jgi:hypothetical protein